MSDYASPGLNRRPDRDREAITDARFWNKVDKSGECWTWLGTISGSWRYGMFRHNGRMLLAHRFAYERYVGQIPDGKVVDHLCHTTACVRPDHLRLVSIKQNAEHRAGPNKNTTSGVRGVSWRSDMRKWGATVGHEGKRIRLGHFATIAEAEAAVLAKRRELFTHNDADR